MVAGNSLLSLKTLEMARFFVVTFFLLGFCGALGYQETYRAAVLEYPPKSVGTSARDSLQLNTDHYVQYIEIASRQGAQIIVLPESGLTGLNITTDTLDDVSTSVPDPQLQLSPCDVHHQTPPGFPSNYSKFFVDLSCAARTHTIYVVVNLIEWRLEDYSRRKIYHNTNVVFDRKGSVIARYRQINAFDNPDYTPGPRNQTTSFDTDFGVTFGVMIGADIYFKNPAEEILQNPTVTDVLLSTAQPSQLPFFSGTSVQHGYAKSNGVNFLVSSLNDPSSGIGGSGIYLANGAILETHISGMRDLRLIIQTVRKNSRTNLSNTCQEGSRAPYRASDIRLFHTRDQNLDHFTFKNLDLSQQEIQETICAEGNTLCCSFNISCYTASGAQPNYSYKLVAFDGAYKLTSNKTIGLRTCGLVACLNDNNDSCGGRHNQSPTITFDKISVKGTFDHKNSHDQPSTLNFNLKPSTEYKYCTNTVNNKIEISIEANKDHESLLTFGLLGRTYDNDDRPEGHNSASPKFGNLFLFISVLVFLLQD